MRTLVSVAICIATLALAAAAAAHDGDRWYWSTATADDVAQRFLYPCTPDDGTCGTPERANGRRIGIKPSDSQGKGGESISGAACKGLGNHIHNSSNPTLPLYKHFVCHLTIDSFWPRSYTRRIWVLMHVLGSPNNRNPDGDHHVYVELLPGHL